MILEGIALAKVAVGVKAVLAHGGLSSVLAHQAVTTASTAGIASAATQTAGTLAGIGTVVAVAKGAERVVDGVSRGRPARAVLGAAGIATAAS